MARTVAVIGGGPAGLYAARLIKRNNPEWAVTVHERSDGAAETFGFGVGLTESTMRNLDGADPETAEKVRAASYAGHDLEMRACTGNAVLHGARNLAIGRAALLQILTDAALVAGVDVRQGSKADYAAVDADVVVAADGVRSKVREKLSAELGVHSRFGRSHFVWCGAGFAVPSAFFSSVETDRGMFVAHAYPYAEDRSTFLIEVDEDTWSSAGLDSLDAAAPVGGTDEASVRLLEEAFADDLRGEHLLTNHTRWTRFTNLSLDRWWTGNTVLLGDAAHTAHYTLGSGTKLAMEDAISLAEALTGEASVTAAFAAYEQQRRPSVERFKLLAGRSQAWWESYRMRSRWPVEKLALSYMTRSGNLTIAHYAADQLETTRAALAWLGDEVPRDIDQLDAWILTRPLDGPALSVPSRTVSFSELEAAGTVETLRWSESDVWGEAADHEIARLSSHADTMTPVLLAGDDDPQSLGARIDFAERVRMQADRCVGIALPAAARSQGAAAIAAGRTDFVVL
jgi:anthraniloyl-CoA monooxygenase